MPRILWLEDTAPADTAPIAALRGAGFDVSAARGGVAAVTANSPDLLICDGMRDRVLLRNLRAEDSSFGDLPVIMLAPDADRNQAIAARLEGADDVLVGPPDTALLLAVVASRLQRVERVRRAARGSAKPQAAAEAPAEIINREQFSRRAVDAARASKDGKKLAVRLVEMGEGAPNGDAVVGALRGLAHDGSTAAQVGDNRFAVLMDAAQSVDVVRDHVGAAAQIASLGFGANGLPPGEMMNAISSVLRKFAKAGRPQELAGTVDEAFAKMVSDASVRIKDLRTTLERRAYRLMFQPIMHLSNGKAHHHEALIRFHPKGMENTGEVIAFAEQVGMVGQLDLAVLDYVIAVLQSSRTPADAKIAVNMSGQTLLDEKAMQPILDRLKSRRAMADRLQIELTESAELTNLTAANEVVQQIRFHGYKVALDDFGAGAASFQYLHALKVDAVKIDGRYVKNLVGSEKDITMLRGLVRMTKDLSLETVAECVETGDQAKLLSELGVDLGQGWHFGKPVPDIAAG